MASSAVEVEGPVFSGVGEGVGVKVGTRVGVGAGVNVARAIASRSEISAERSRPTIVASAQKTIKTARKRVARVIHCCLVTVSHPIG
jgi:ribose 5-phosphate isomerase